MGSAKTSRKSKNTRSTAVETGAADRKKEFFSSERTDISQEGLDKIIQDVLGGADGLASVFNQSRTAGIFNDSVSANAAGNLATKLAGELAVLTSEKIKTGTEEDEETTSKRKDFREKVIGKEAAAEGDFKIPGF